jgi:BirA family biotin operon repressor/biotin-[acetyl-CoA-carboxylase] ligase
VTGALARATIGPLLRGRFGTPYIYAPECESTQLLLLGSDLPEGAVAVTDHQTAGRGRLGRHWEEPAGTSVLCSVLLRPPLGRRLPELSLVAALAVAETIEAHASLDTQVKWPNDLLIESRKVAGTLGETRAAVVVTGIGINVNQAEGQLPDAAASLRTLTGREHDRAALLATLIAGLERRYDEWLVGGLARFHRELNDRDFLRGRQVQVGGASGTAVGIDHSGRLELDAGGERRFVQSGEAVLYE